MTLGFGTAELGRSLSGRERVRLVEVAFDAGIRYFDTAPLYGAGAAETALGRLRGEAAIATKVGIVPPSLPRLALGRLAGRPASAAGGRFAPADVRDQLEGSLRRLRRDSVDVLLLHAVEPAAALDPSLLETLAELRREGTIRRAGIATGGRQSAAILASETAGFPEVVQLAAADTLDAGEAQLVLHSVLAGRVGTVPAAHLLQAAAQAHPDAVILVGSRREEHIREAAEALV
jgi:aryl-alcohol dehydrogenase-like predicted oxidoreductase